MKIQKRDGKLQEFEGEKIAQAIRKAFRSTGTSIEEAVLKDMIEDITTVAAADGAQLSVEVVQDLVEEKLMQHHFYKEAKNYILYRQKRTEARQVVHDLVHAPVSYTHLLWQAIANWICLLRGIMSIAAF